MASPDHNELYHENHFKSCIKMGYKQYQVWNRLLQVDGETTFIILSADVNVMDVRTQMCFYQDALVCIECDQPWLGSAGGLWLLHTKVSWARFLSIAWSKLRLCSANHRAGYFSNLACDWLSIVWAYSEQETEKGPWSDEVRRWVGGYPSVVTVVMEWLIHCLCHLWTKMALGRRWSFEIYLFIEDDISLNFICVFCALVNDRFSLVEDLR